MGNIIEFDLREIPHAKDEPAKAYFPVASNIRTATTEDICKEINRATTHTEADVKGVIEALKQVLVSHLKNGERVELEGIGTFSASIASEEPITRPDDKLTARGLYLDDVRFRAKRSLRAAIRQATFHRTQTPRKAAYEWTTDEIMAHLDRYMTEHGLQMLSRIDIQTATGYSRAMTRQWITKLMGLGLLKKLGTRHAPYYVITGESSPQETVAQD